MPQNTKKGFTIVELLIVVVVIAILAAISIVAYTGIRERAVTAAYTSAAEQWHRFLEAERALTGTLPLTTGNVYACLGSSAADFPAADGFAAGECVMTIGSTISYSYDESFIDSMQMNTSAPNGLLPVSTFTHSSGIIFRSRGITVLPSSWRYRLEWFPQVSGQCGSGVASSGEPGLLTGGGCSKTVVY